MKLKISTTSIAVFLLSILFLFLPFSSWLVSITGNPEISLIRDILVILIFIFGLVGIFKSRSKPALSGNLLIIFLSLSIILWSGISFFWREASFEQWLRGFRFSLTPMILLVSLLILKLSDAQRKKIYAIVLLGSLIILFLSILEFKHVKLPLVSDLSGEGKISTIHKIGGGYIRLQSVLSGPNALGLFLLSSLASLLICGRYISRKIYFLAPLFLFALIWTFSRSSWIGFIVFALFSFFYFLRKKFGSFMVSVWLASFALLISFVIWFGYRSQTFNALITHGASSTERVEQYKRVWDQRYDIGLLGKGAGGAGPTSQKRLDDGPNYWTENIYLDTFEETGLVGLVLFSLLLVGLLHSLSRRKEDAESLIAASILLGYLASGLFINIFTGQAGIYLLILICGLALGAKNEKNFN